MAEQRLRPADSSARLLREKYGTLVHGFRYFADLF